MKIERLWVMAAALICGASMFTSCSVDDNPIVTPTAKSIVILYDNDVHCSIDGYTKMAGLPLIHLEAG